MGALRPDAVSFTGLIVACSKRGSRDHARASQLFEEMQRRALLPNVITCSALISTCETGKQLTWALELFRIMERQRLAPNSITYDAALRLCEKALEPKRALSF